MISIENVGNLVCPTLFDLGERAKVVVLSVTEGEDKPMKCPHMFQACQVLRLSGQTGEGTTASQDWPRHQRARQSSLVSA